MTPLSVAAAEAALEAVASGGSNGGGLQRTGVAVPCSVYISAPQRRLAARLHSAGHLLDLAVRSVVADLQPTVPLVASKGYHFPDGPWVEYEGALASASPAAFQAAVQQACQPLLAADVPTTVREVDAAGCVAAGLAPGDIAHLPAGTSVRIVAVGDASNVCPCGGTHVERAGEIGALVVTKVSSKKGKTRVCYEVSA